MQCSNKLFCFAGGSDMYAVLICGNDPDVKRNAAVFERDLCGIESVLTDSRIVGIRYALEHFNLYFAGILML